MARRSRSRPTSPPASVSDGEPAERLQKVLAAAGIGSRRSCEELILAGRVDVDRQQVTQLGTRADPARQQIRVDGVLLRSAKRVYYLLNKPPGVVSTNRDPAGRPRVIDLVPSTERLFTVGRLDVSSVGLILMTNDGDLANRLAHPRYGIEKTYLVEVAGQPGAPELAKLRRGVHLAEARVQAARLRVKHRKKRSTILEMVLNEGRNREIRRMLASVGHKVQYLKRIALGPLRLGDLPLGAYRPLTREEIRSLHSASQPKKKASQPRKKAASKSEETGPHRKTFKNGTSKRKRPVKKKQLAKGRR